MSKECIHFWATLYLCISWIIKCMTVSDVRCKHEENLVAFLRTTESRRHGSGASISSMKFAILLNEQKLYVSYLHYFVIVCE